MLQNNNNNKKKDTSIELMVELSKVGKALIPTCTSPSTDRCSYLTSIVGVSSPTLYYSSNLFFIYIIIKSNLS